jgi:hypothetical protein
VYQDVGRPGPAWRDHVTLGAMDAMTIPGIIYLCDQCRVTLLRAGYTGKFYIPDSGAFPFCPTCNTVEPRMIEYRRFWTVERFADHVVLSTGSGGGTIGGRVVPQPVPDDDDDDP